MRLHVMSCGETSVATRDEEPATWLCLNLGARWGAPSEAFQKLFAEIRRAGEPMQSPVVVRYAGQKTTMCFKVRDSFRLTNRAMFLVHTPVTRVRFSSFGGWVDEKDCARRHADLLACSPTPRSNVWAVYQYDSPFWPWLGRHNEVVVF